MKIGFGSTLEDFFFIWKTKTGEVKQWRAGRNLHIAGFMFGKNLVCCWHAGFLQGPPFSKPRFGDRGNAIAKIKCQLMLFCRENAVVVRGNCTAHFSPCSEEWQIQRNPYSQHQSFTQRAFHRSHRNWALGVCSWSGKFVPLHWPSSSSLWQPEFRLAGHRWPALGHRRLQFGSEPSS